MNNLIEADGEQQLSYAFTALCILEIVWQQLNIHVNTSEPELPTLIQQRNNSGPQVFQQEIMSVTAIELTDAYTRAVTNSQYSEVSIDRYEQYVVPMALQIILDCEYRHLAAAKTWDTVMGLILTEQMAA